MASSSLVLRPPSVPNEIMNGLILDADDASCASSTVSRAVAPWLMLPPEFGEDTTIFKFYRLAEGDVIRVPAEQQEQKQEFIPDPDSICLSSLSKGWLVCIQPKDCYLFMFNPLSGKTIQLPSIETFPCVNGIIRNAHSSLVESVLDHIPIPRTPQHMSSFIVRRMILSSPDPMDEDCIAMAIYGPEQRLAFCRRPAEANSWTALDGPLTCYDQIVFHGEKKLFFALTDYLQLEAWDLHGNPIKRSFIHNQHLGAESFHPVNQHELDHIKDYSWDGEYLVYDHQSHELFIVVRFIAYGVAEDGTLVHLNEHLVNIDARRPYRTQIFLVYRLDFIDHDHVDIEFLKDNLGNRAFFIGSNPGFSLSTTMFPELRPNSIYFTDDLIDSQQVREDCGGHDLGIYDYKEGTILPCYYPIDLEKIHMILPAPIWLTPDVDAIAWPPF